MRTHVFVHVHVGEACARFMAKNISIVSIFSDYVVEKLEDGGMLLKTTDQRGKAFVRSWYIPSGEVIIHLLP